MKKGVRVLWGWILWLVCILWVFFRSGGIPVSNDAPVEIPNQKQEEVFHAYQHQQAITPIVYDRLTVAIPQFLYSKGFDTIKKQLEDTYQLKVQYIPIAGRKHYREMIRWKKFSTIDLVLIPYDRSHHIQGQPIDLGELLTNYFDPIVHTLLLKKKMLPFLLDPAVVWVRSQKDIHSLALDDLVLQWSFLKNNEYRSVLAMFDDDNIDLIIDHVRKTKNIALLEALQAVILRNQKETAWMDHLSAIYNSLGQKDAICKQYPRYCLLPYGFVDVMYGYYTDQYIFQNMITPHTPTLHVFPYAKEKYPVRVRWFVITPQSSHQQEAKKFLQTLVRDFSYPKDLWIPAILGESYYQALLNSDLTFINGAKNQWYIPHLDIKMPAFSDVLSGEKDIKEYYQELLQTL